MTYRGAFMAGAKVTVTDQPDPDKRHATKSQPDNHWSAPPADPAQVPGDYTNQATPPMTGRGIVLDLGHRFGHEGTAVTAHARAPFIGPTSQGAAQDAAANAHGDSTSAYFTPHAYAPIAKPFAGESYSVDRADGAAGVPHSGRTIAKAAGGWFVDGPREDSYAPTGYRLGVTRRWAERKYSSPLLGAQWSSNALRGVIPQTVAVPVNQAPSGQIKNSGLGSQQRQLLRTFTIPALFRNPPSASDQQVAAQPVGQIDGPVI